MKKAKDGDTSSADSLISMTYSTPRICSLKEAGSHVLKFGPALLRLLRKHSKSQQMLELIPVKQRSAERPTQLGPCP